MELKSARPVSVIAAEIRSDWKKVSFSAMPYLESMEEINSISDRYGAEDAKTIVLYFLSNATSWQGPVARRIKAELKNMTS